MTRAQCTTGLQGQGVSSFYICWSYQFLVNMVRRVLMTQGYDTMILAIKNIKMELKFYERTAAILKLFDLQLEF